MTIWNRRCKYIGCVGDENDFRKGYERRSKTKLLLQKAFAKKKRTNEAAKINQNFPIMSLCTAQEELRVIFQALHVFGHEKYCFASADE